MRAGAKTPARCIWANGTMALRVLRLGLLLAAAVVPADAPFADPAPTIVAPANSPAIAPDPDRLALARQIAAITQTPEKAFIIINRSEKWIFETQSEKWFHGVLITDSTLSVMVSDYFHEVEPRVRTY